MKTILRLMVFVALPLAAAGCEDDHFYPGPNPGQSGNYEEIMVTIPLQFNPEFDAVFAKSVHTLKDITPGPGLWDIMIWWGLDDNQPIYLLDLDGNGDAPYLGEFNFHLTSIWASADFSGSYATITSRRIGQLNVIFEKGKPDFTPDYPYDLMKFERNFTVKRFDNNYKGSGTVTFSIPDPLSDVINLKWDGTLNVVIKRQ